ncbi:MAG: DUF4013 domain-containing protein [Acidobacteria bacterium]|nr:DUF4013 domain-containing protein [Acidobacteriota bacterium]
MVQFRCPYCGAAGERTMGGLAADGTIAACGTCVQLFRLYPDGRTEEAGEDDAVPSPAAQAHPPAVKDAEPEKGELLLFLCPFCGNEIKVPKAKLPPEGARGKCSGCQARLRLKPDGNVELDGKQAQPYSSGASAPSQTKGVEQGEQGEAAHDGPEPLGDIDHCYLHPDEPPARSCVECHRYLCAKCAVERRIEGQLKPVMVCAACGGATAPLPKRVRWTPFYKDLPKVLAAPVTGGALWYFGVMVLLQIVKHFAGAIPIAGLIPFLLLTVFQWVFYLEVVRDVAGGSYEFPGWPDMSDVLAMMTSFLKVVFVTIVSLLPVFIASCILMAPLRAFMATAGPGEKPGLAPLLLGPVGVVIALFFFVYLFYLPLCVAIVAVFDTVLPALNPILIIKIMSRIGKPYVFAALFWAALFIFNAVIMILLGKAGLVGGVIYPFFDVYFTLVFCYSLGRVIAENEHKIGWS